MKHQNPFDHIVVFCDGACSGNPGPGGWGAVLATPDGKVKELGAGSRETTNNRMELIAACSALKELSGDMRPVGIYTDSSYVIRGITEWIWGWRKRGWTTATGGDVSNRDLWEWLSELVAERSAKVSWHYVRGHAGIPGNERVDEIAVAFTKNQHVDLYEGPLIRYQVAIFDIPDDTSLPEMKERKAKVAAFSYLSLVDGHLRRHSTWADCERLVKGRSGAKFKKAASEKEEAEIIASWGYAQKDLDR